MSTDLLTELSAINAIYTPTTILASSSSPSSSSTTTISTSTSTSTSTTTIYTLTLPHPHATSLLLSFPPTYPALPPTVNGIGSVGDHAKRGSGQRVLALANQVLDQVWREGEVMLFDLIEGLGERLHEVNAEAAGVGQELNRSADGDNSHVDSDGRGGGRETQDPSCTKKDNTNPPPQQQHPPREPQDQPLLPAFPSTNPPQNQTPHVFPPPQWTLSPPRTVKKSLFLARATPIHSPAHAAACLTHLLAHDKHAAKATHNISAWRVAMPSEEKVKGTLGKVGMIEEDCDDDGEDAAGGRVLKVMQMMGCEGVLVVVSRWYGGVKLGPARFGVIGGVAREVIVTLREEEGGGVR